MRYLDLTFALTAALVAAFPGAARAHHSIADFDGTRGTTIKGRVERVLRVYPHTQLFVSVPRANGTRETWTVESESPNLLSRLGWEDGTIQAGDTVTVVGARAKDGSTTMRCKLVELESGLTLPCFPGPW
jgi:hypothetical protein